MMKLVLVPIGLVAATIGVVAGAATGVFAVHHAVPVEGRGLVAVDRTATTQTGQRVLAVPGVTSSTVLDRVRWMTQGEANAVIVDIVGTEQTAFGPVLVGTCVAGSCTVGDALSLAGATVLGGVDDDR